MMNVNCRKKNNLQNYLTDLNEVMLTSLIFSVELALILALTCGWVVSLGSVLDQICLQCNAAVAYRAFQNMMQRMSGRAEVAKLGS